MLYKSILSQNISCFNYIYLYTQIQTHLSWVIMYNVFLTVGHNKKMEIPFSRYFTSGPTLKPNQNKKIRKYKITPSHKNSRNFVL